MIKAEFSTPVTVGYLITLYEVMGMTVDINDGEIVKVNFEEA